MKTELCLCLLVLFGLTNTEEYQGCAKDGMIEFHFSCNNTMKRVFIINAYLTNKDCSSTVQYSYDIVLEVEFTREMKKTCNTMTECRAYKNWKNKLERQGDFQYYVIFSCKWLFPETPNIEVFRREQYRKFGNQFVVKSRGYPYLFTASDFQCNISKYREDTQVTVQLIDFHNEMGIFCIKTSVSSGCMQSGRSISMNIKNHESFTVQGTIVHSGDASPKIEFYLIIQASRSSSRLDDQPPDTQFELSCRSTYINETTEWTARITQPSFQTERTATSPLTRENTNGDGTTQSHIILTTSTINQMEQVPTGSKESSLGPVVGGAVSAVLLLVLVFSLGFFLGRRQLKARSTTSENNPTDELTAARRRSVDNFEDAYETMDDGKTNDGYEMPTQRQNNDGYEIPANRIDGPACEKVYTTLSSDKSKF